VKPAGSPLAASPDAGSDLEHPGRVHYQEALRTLLMKAYDAAYFQIQGPDWLGDSRFVIDAIMPPETTRQQLRQILQNLLVERFKIAAHREIKETAGYLLSVAKNGPKLKIWTEGSPHEGVAVGPPDPSQPPVLGPDGFPLTVRLAGRAAERGILMSTAPYGKKVCYLGETMYELLAASPQRRHPKLSAGARHFQSSGIATRSKAGEGKDSGGNAGHRPY
jgi:Protein of unknown function (DUF3738)